MKQWDIWTCDFDEAGPHPAVIISHPDRIARAPLVNVLIGSSQRANRPARENEILLNGADGLDWETLVKCDLMYLVEKERLYRRRGKRWNRQATRNGSAHQCVLRVHSGLKSFSTLSPVLVTFGIAGMM